jgi:FkbM family methyltransferase
LKLRPKRGFLALKTRLVHGKFDVKYHVVDGRDLISNTLRRYGVYEPEVLAASGDVLQGLGARPEDVRGRVIDVGANLGTYTLPLAKFYPGLEFVCFEPQLPVCDLLRRNVALNELGNVVVHAIGLSDVARQLATTLPDYETEPNIGALSFDAEVRANDYEVKTRGESQDVVLRTLDSFDLRDVRLLKNRRRRTRARGAQRQPRNARSQRFSADFVRGLDVEALVCGAAAQPDCLGRSARVPRAKLWRVQQLGATCWGVGCSLTAWLPWDG